MKPTMDDERFAAYLASMPLAYRKAFAEDDIAAHEAIVRRRGDSATHVEIWRELADNMVAIAVVADDKPGLLSIISAALVATRIDVVRADAFVRKHEDGQGEAIDLLWIRRLPGPTGAVRPIRARDIVAVAEAIEEAAGSGERHRVDSLAFQRAASPVSVRLPSSPDAAETVDSHSVRSVAKIRFDADPKDGSTVLTVEAVDRPGLLLAVTQTLFRAGLQIIGLRATTEQGAAVDSFHIAEVDGSAPPPERLLSLQAEILGAIDDGTGLPERRSAG